MSVKEDLLWVMLVGKTEPLLLSFPGSKERKHKVIDDGDDDNNN